MSVVFVALWDIVTEKPFYRDKTEHAWPNHGVQIITHSKGVVCSLQSQAVLGVPMGKENGGM